MRFKKDMYKQCSVEGFSASINTDPLTYKKKIRFRMVNHNYPSSAKIWRLGGKEAKSLFTMLQSAFE